MGAADIDHSRLPDIDVRTRQAAQMTGLEFNGRRWRVIVDGTFCGASEDKQLAERHLQNVQALRDLEPTRATMTVEQLYHDHGKRNPASSGTFKTVPAARFNGQVIHGLEKSRNQGWFYLYNQDDTQFTAIDCDLVEMVE